MITGGSTYAQLSRKFCSSPVNAEEVPSVASFSRIFTRMMQTACKGPMAKPPMISTRPARSKFMKGGRKGSGKSICSRINWPKSCREAGRPADLCQKAYQEGGRLSFFIKSFNLHTFFSDKSFLCLNKVLFTNSLIA